MTTYVYRCFDYKDKLLYIGASKHLRGRIRSHCKNSKWGDEFASFTAKAYSSRNAALIAEQRAILREQPIHNKVSKRLSLRSIQKRRAAKLHPSIRFSMALFGSKGGKASWAGLTKRQRTIRARKSAAKRNGNGR